MPTAIAEPSATRTTPVRQNQDAERHADATEQQISEDASSGDLIVGGVRRFYAQHHLRSPKFLRRTRLRHPPFASLTPSSSQPNLGKREVRALNDVLQIKQLCPLKLASGVLNTLCPDFLSDESGQDLIEYALIAALLGLASVSAVRGLGTSISSAYSSVASNLTSNT
jgi:pilus assembly protein Flp/PilA